ncbi:unnamed protein product [Brassica napus]|uniref:(rape) hypothetical protein n=1 Tax=Brassica napus TaxID=3708 RepID=A0A816PE35_BRANA|nr:unnamed protein product [Brassica napus]
MAIGSRVTNSPDCATPEVVYLSSPIVLYGLLVKWVYTVPVDRLEGGNLERLRAAASLVCVTTSCRWWW